MEKDKLIPGNILFSDYFSQYTTDGNNITVVHGFSPNDHGSIYGFVQTSKFELITADRWDSCLRGFNRPQNRIFKFFGECRRAGYRDGTDALFRGPKFVIQDNQTPCIFYVTDHGNGAVRMVANSQTPQVTTLIKSYNYSKLYTGTTQDKTGQYLYILYRYGLERFDLSRYTSIDILSSDTMFTNSAAIYDNDIGYLGSIILHEGLIIISDTNRHTLVVINVSMATYSTSLVCTGMAGHLSGNSSFCKLNEPFGLLEMDGDIYIGERGVISILRGRSIKSIHCLIRW